jgi:glycosyltransferase involved in cell wall biosynthesis
MVIKCLHIGKYYPPFAGGMENYTADLLTKIASLDASPIIFAHNHKLNFKLIKISGDPFSVYLTPSFGRLLYAPVSPFFLCHLRKVIRKTRPDILHIHLPNLSAFWLLLSKDCRQIPWVVHWHSDVITDKQPWYFKLAYRVYGLLEKALLKACKQIIATSEPYLKASRPLQPFMAKCTIIPLGIRDNNYSEPPISPAHTFNLLAIGRLTYYKGFHNLVHAAEAIENIRITIIGTGEEQNRLNSLIQSSGTGDTVELGGYVSNEQLEVMVKECDVICLPSIERTEAFGVVLLEAMRAGKAVIAGNVMGSGIGWVVADEVTGLLITPNSPKSLREAIIRLRDNPKLVRELGLSGRRRYEEKFIIDKTAAQVIKVYEDCLPSLPA